MDLSQSFQFTKSQDGNVPKTIFTATLVEKSWYAVSWTLSNRTEIAKRWYKDFNIIEQFQSGNWIMVEVKNQEINTERRWVSLNVDLILDLPVGIDAESQEGQDFLRKEFIDYLESAEYIALGFVIGDVAEDNE